jgi:acetyl esterase/lipase
MGPRQCQTDDGVNLDIAKACGVVVAAVDFRRAIDDRLDLTVEDAIAATDWVFGHRSKLGAEKVIIAGESSGAHLAACAFLEVRTRGELEDSPDSSPSAVASTHPALTSSDDRMARR